MMVSTFAFKNGLQDEFYHARTYRDDGDRLLSIPPRYIRLPFKFSCSQAASCSVQITDSTSPPTIVTTCRAYHSDYLHQSLMRNNDEKDRWLR